MTDKTGLDMAVVLYTVTAGNRRAPVPVWLTEGPVRMTSSPE